MGVDPVSGRPPRIIPFPKKPAPPEAAGPSGAAPAPKPDRPEAASPAGDSTGPADSSEALAARLRVMEARMKVADDYYSQSRVRDRIVTALMEFLDG